MSYNAFTAHVQERLKGLGFDPGPVDGLDGNRTRKALDAALPPKEKKVTGFTLSARSLKSLEGVHPKLVEVVKEAATLTTVPFVVTDGVRSVDGMWRAWGQGRTVAEIAGGALSVNTGCLTSVAGRPRSSRSTTSGTSTSTARRSRSSAPSSAATCRSSSRAARPWAAAAASCSRRCWPAAATTGSSRSPRAAGARRRHARS